MTSADDEPDLERSSEAAADPTTAPAPDGSWMRDMASRAERFVGRRNSTRPPRWLTLLVVVALAVGAWFAYRSLPTDEVEFDATSLVLLGLLSLPGLVLNGAEYKLTAFLGGVHVGLVSSMRIALYGAAANLLPLPGASMVRIEAMRRAGAPLRRAATITVAVGLGWLGLSLLLAGIVLVPAGLRSIPFLASGGLVLVAVAAVISRGRPWRQAVDGFAMVLAVELAFVLLQALRLWLALRSFGVSVGIQESLTLGVSNAVAAASGFLPGGLGIREAVAAALGPMVGLEPSTAFLAALIDRVVALAMLAILSVPLLGLSIGRRRGASRGTAVNR